MNLLTECASKYFGPNNIDCPQFLIPKTIQLYAN